MNKSYAEFIFHVFIYFWAHVVTLNSRQHCRLFIALAGGLTVIARVSRTNSCFKISSLMLPSAVAEYWFFHFSLLWHLTEGREVTLQPALLWELSGSWETDGPITLFLGGTSFQHCGRKSLMRIWGELRGLLCCLYPEMDTPASRGRDEKEENIPLKFTIQVQNEWKELGMQN